MGNRLSNETLAALPHRVAQPAYDRSALRTGIVHLGVGAFHRCHQAVYIDDCLAAGETGWGIVGASLRSAETRDALAPQDGLYTLSARSGAGETLRVVGAITSLLVGRENPAALLDVMTDPGVKIVTLTVTEKAYLRAPGGGLDASHPDVTRDLALPDSPNTVHGFLVEAMRRRRAAGTAAFTVLCCDNLPDNGATVRRVVVDFARLADAALADWIGEAVAFPSSMVDRIVPATTDADRARISAALGVTDAWPVVTEPFTQWVVEDHFPSGRPPWERFGVQMAKDVKPFEDMKLRLLNGSHSAIAYLGLLKGHETVDHAFADPGIRGFVEGLWREAIPTLPGGAGLDPQRYIGALAERYANPALGHRTRQIATDGSQKLPQRIVAAALARLRDGKPADHLALVPAAWIEACAQRGGKLPAGHFTDPLDEKLAHLFAPGLAVPALVEEVFALTGFAAGNPLRPRLQKLVTAHLSQLRATGVATALQSLEVS